MSISLLINYRVLLGGIRFWRDKWPDRGRLQDLFPVIFKAVKAKDASIADMIVNNSWNFEFRRSLNANKKLQWDLLRRDCYPIPVLVEAKDEVDIMENFSAKKCYEVLTGTYPPCNFDSHLWKHNIPNKVSFILWASFHDSISTRDMLVHRGMSIQSDLCVLCNDEKETFDHMFLHCTYSFAIWDYFIKAFKISWSMPRNLFQFFEAWFTNILQGMGKKVWKIIHYAICWTLWKERNGRVFGGRQKSVAENIDLVKQRVVLWSCDTDSFRFVPPSLIWSNGEVLMSE
ncbi:uncharacterized protein LOC113327852 [Papaver somniferum]|uniref:uncharacterized protein LOC113327852 n=1 Tax=Papaver somniferum TaxID=3469 RepID=UPI000E6FA385|nr:uncharacterized protein LOC113327852 [Papaver somniferum]